jgi:hypothetical protein
MSTHVSHALTCESCGCTRECSGDCTTCQVCGASWIIVRCFHCGEVPVYEGTLEHAAIVDVTRALDRGHAPLGAMTCPLCCGEILGKDVRR